MVVVVAVAGVRMVGEDNNQQKAAAGVAKTADVAAAGAEVALAAAAVAAAAVEAVAVAVAEMSGTVAAIAMAMAEGPDWREGLGVGRTSLGFHVYNLVTIWRKVGQCF
jgi:hypothetical protein